MIPDKITVTANIRCSEELLPTLEEDYTLGMFLLSEEKYGYIHVMITGEKRNIELFYKNHVVEPFETWLEHAAIQQEKPC